MMRIESTIVTRLKNKMMNEARLLNVWHLLCGVLELNIPGDLAELGCNEGTTAILMSLILQDHQQHAHQAPRHLHVFDSFQGMPEPSKEDGDTPLLQGGDLPASREKLLENFARFEAPAPLIHVGWFRDTLVELPDQIAFAHLDADFYQGTLEGLKALYPRLSTGAIVVLDDYCDPSKLNRWNRLPGVKQACDEFFEGRSERVQVLVCGHYAQGYFRKA